MGIVEADQPLAIWEDGWQGILARSPKGSTIPITYARRIAKPFPCRPAFADNEPRESNVGWRKRH
jgi:hypothetical protein